MDDLQFRQTKAMEDMAEALRHIHEVLVTISQNIEDITEEVKCLR